MAKNSSNYRDQNGETPHFYYQRSVTLEQELKELKLRLIKVKNESNRNKEILQNQVEKLVSISRKQEILLVELEQYRQICRTGIAIICRLCGLIIENEDVMQHLTDTHLLEFAVSKTSILESNHAFLKNQLGNDDIYENKGLKCFEFIMQDADDAEKIDVNVSISTDNTILIKITGLNDINKDISLNSFGSLLNLSSQISESYPEIPLPKIMCECSSNAQKFLKYVLKIKSLRESSIVKSFLNL
ncbi:hypothetical protein OJ253_3198 [Cryptosporidium canis]|uniref:Uncharacterized protein n=1 Tax=Cryptosporidium canis TaxID=195482 RepID=A0A9D5DE95_9CRYT|nr:hypothetical protein OJ253_3198 [Cryptosporidium canis]